MSRRRGGKSRRDRYGLDDEVKADDTDVVAAAPYQLATDERMAPSAVGAPRNPTSTNSESNNNEETKARLWKLPGHKKTQADEEDEIPDESEPLSPRNNQEYFHDEPIGAEEDNDDDDEEDDESLEGYDMTLQELMYSTSSFYAIVVPGSFLSR